MDARAEPRSGPFLPLLLLTLAFVGWLAFQAVQTAGDRGPLAALNAGLDAQEEAARKVRTALDAVATSTAKLADAGNPNARGVVERLRQRGITINAAGASGPTP
jgi:hypothetical protein